MIRALPLLLLISACATTTQRRVDPEMPATAAVLAPEHGARFAYASPFKQSLFASLGNGGLKSGGGSSGGGVSLSAANTWTAKQTINVADGSDAIALDLGDRLNIADGTGFYLYSDGSFLLSNGSFRASALSVNGAAWGAAATGKMTMDAGNSTGAPGNATLNNPTGRSAFAAAASAVTITNNLVSTTSIVLPVLQTVDGTLTQILTCVPASGSFTCTGNAAATGTTSFGWMVIN